MGRLERVYGIKLIVLVLFVLLLFVLLAFLGKVKKVVCVVFLDFFSPGVLIICFFLDSAARPRIQNPTSDEVPDSGKFQSRCLSVW